MSKRRGQATTEWAVLLSVIVVAIVAAAWVFVGPFIDQMGDFGKGAETVYASGDLAK